MRKRQETLGFRLAMVIGVVTIALGSRLSEASAQTSAPQPPSGSQSESPAPATPGTPKSPLPSTGSSNPSDNLSRSGGVIQPPAVTDPGMARPAPNPGAQSTPVIPPPGSPGNNPDVVPK
jgi:hypothetical protein